MTIIKGTIKNFADITIVPCHHENKGQLDFLHLTITEKCRLFFF